VGNGAIPERECKYLHCSTLGCISPLWKTLGNFKVICKLCLFLLKETSLRKLEKPGETHLS